MSETTDIQHIPTHLIAGPLGSGKTTVLGNLLRQRPADERWAILINEFGQVGIDAALLQRDAAGVQLAEIPGGCLCCINGVPFQVGLARLLRRSRPHRLFIEASGLGHPAALMRQLLAAPWQGVLALQPLIMVLDAPRLLTGQTMAKEQQEALAIAGLVVLNKAGSLSPAQRSELLPQMQPAPALCSSDGVLALAQLPAAPAPSGPATALPGATNALPAGIIWRDAQDWHCHEQLQDDRYSIGWKMHPDQIFALCALRDWLDSFPWQRAKGVLHTDQGWMAFNGLNGETPLWRGSEWRRDSRLELIASVEPGSKMPLRQQLETTLRAALVNSLAIESRNPL